MELKLEWQRRIEKWMRVLVKDIYKPIAKIDFAGFSSMERLDYADAVKGDFKPLNQGDKWGKEWEYLWAKANINVPSEAAGKHLVMKLNLGGESSVFINGEEFGARRNDWVRDDIHRISDLILTKNAVAGDTYEVVMEAYAGHEDTGCDYGPVLPGDYKPKAPDELRTSVGESALCIWNETAYQLYMDVKIIWEAVHAMTDDSLRYWDLWEGLKAFTNIVDFEQDEEGRNKNYEEARARLTPLFEAKNGSTAPQMYAFGHAHIDVCWLWPYAETERKIHRTFAAQIRHMDEYPEYIFLQSQPHLYRMVKELYPSLYEKIKEKVKAGQWIPEGGMWVEADTNISSGESLIRQFMHGKRFFLDEFGIDNKMLWLPDVFGYNAALPQIMKGCGVDYFSTQKIWWAYHGGDRFPYNYFNWVGMDGSVVPSFMHDDYNSDITAGTMIRRWKDRKQRNDVRGFMVPYGYGDGGGGPSRDFIEYIRREEDFEGCPKTKNAHPLDFFREHPAPVDDYVGELYLQCHRGVQSSQCKTKEGNRRGEFGLREAEFLGTIAKIKGAEYPLAEMDELWKKILLCQFHDILPGSSISRVYKEAEAIYAQVLSDLADIKTTLATSLCEGTDAVTVSNSLSFTRTAIITLPAGFEGAKANGNTLPVQKLGDRLIAEVTVPACGSVTVTAAAPKQLESGATASVSANGATISNEYVSAVFNEYGAITSIKDKNGNELAKGLCNDMRMYKDISVSFEAWDVDTSYEFCPVELPEKATFELVSAGPLKAVVKITRKINDSSFVQLVSLGANARRVDFDTTVEWQELHKMLKVNFDVDYHCEEAYHEIQFGYVKRPNHRSRPFDFDRFEVANHKWTALVEEHRGFAVLNDSKYGVNVLGSSINLTLLRAPYSPDPECDRGTQHFVYSFFAYDGSFMQSGIYKEAYDINVPAEIYKGSAKDGSVLNIANDNVILEVLKPAEDGSSDYILRMYEAMRTKTDTKLTLNLPCSSIAECNMMEEDLKSLNFAEVDGGISVDLTFKPFEIKTLRVKI